MVSVSAYSAQLLVTLRNDTCNCSVELYSSDMQSVLRLLLVDVLAMTRHVTCASFLVKHFAIKSALPLRALAEIQSLSSPIIAGKFFANLLHTCDFKAATYNTQALVNDSVAAST